MTTKKRKTRRIDAKVARRSSNSRKGLECERADISQNPSRIMIALQLPPENGYTFSMMSLREQVCRPRTFDPIPLLSLSFCFNLLLRFPHHVSDIPRLSIRVAGNVDDRCWRELEELFEEQLVASFTRWVDQNRRLIRRERDVL